MLMLMLTLMLMEVVTQDSHARIGLTSRGVAICDLGWSAEIMKY
jgi:hypothetical protein